MMPTLCQIMDTNAGFDGLVDFVNDRWPVVEVNSDTLSNSIRCRREVGKAVITAIFSERPCKFNFSRGLILENHQVFFLEREHILDCNLLGTIFEVMVANNQMSILKNKIGITANDIASRTHPLFARQIASAIPLSALVDFCLFMDEMDNQTTRNSFIDQALSWQMLHGRSVLYTVLHICETIQVSQETKNKAFWLALDMARTISDAENAIDRCVRTLVSVDFAQTALSERICCGPFVPYRCDSQSTLVDPSIFFTSANMSKCEITLPVARQIFVQRIVDIAGSTYQLIGYARAKNFVSALCAIYLLWPEDQTVLTDAIFLTRIVETCAGEYCGDVLSRFPAEGSAQNASAEIQCAAIAHLARRARDVNFARLVASHLGLHPERWCAMTPELNIVRSTLKHISEVFRVTFAVAIDAAVSPEEKAKIRLFQTSFYVDYRSHALVADESESRSAIVDECNYELVDLVVVNTAIVDDKCSICHGAFVRALLMTGKLVSGAESGVVMTKCCHGFHSACMQEFFNAASESISHKCPMCRCDISDFDLKIAEIPRDLSQEQMRDMLGVSRGGSASIARFVEVFAI
jgi:Anaphase-promoting complex subunit 11 RING-H2 finger